MDISLKSLEEAVSIRRKIETLEKRLDAICKDPRQPPHRAQANEECRSSTCKNCRCNEGTVGKAKRKGSACLDHKNEGRNYCSGKNKAFTVDESSMGSEEKSKRKEVNSTQHAFSQWLARAIS
jgi:hypothetical protein